MICPNDYSACVDCMCVTTCIITGTDSLRPCGQCGKVYDPEFFDDLDGCRCDDPEPDYYHDGVFN